MLDLSFHDALEVKCFHNTWQEPSLVEDCKSLSYDNLANLGVLGDRVNVLHLDKSLKVVFQQFSEVVLELRAAEKLKDLFPSWCVLVFAKVRLECACKNFKSCGLSNTVGTHKTQYLTWARSGEPVELEGIGAITMCDFICESLR